MKILITCVIDLGRLYITLSDSLIFTKAPHWSLSMQCLCHHVRPLECEYMDWSSPQLQESTFTPRSAIWARTMIASTPLGRCMWYASRSRSQRQYQRVQKNCRTLLLLWILRYTDASHMVIIVEHHLKYTRLGWLSVLDMSCGLEYLTTILC